MKKTTPKIAFQGSAGAFSDIACRTVYPQWETLPCATFEEVFEAVRLKKADLAMIPVDNTLAGRVADVHHLIPKGGLYIVAEHFQAIRMALLGVPGARVTDVRHVISHVHALPQCRGLIKRLKLKATAQGDTATAARDIAARGDKTYAAIASAHVAPLYGLQVLEDNVQDSDNNTTRFLIWARAPQTPPTTKPAMTALLFKVRNLPAALYKALGGFATNGVSLAKLESYVDPDFQAAEFYCEVEGHQESPALARALEELRFFADDVRLLGTFPAHKFRHQRKV